MNLLTIILLLLLSVVIGGIIVQVLDKMQQKHVIKFLLSFSGGFLLSIAFVHFLPELYTSNKATQIGAFILLGFLVQLVLEYFSGGIEHGHIHATKNKKIPWVLLFSLSVHSFIEGIPLMNIELAHAGHDHAHMSANSLLLGILLHQTPVAIALMTLLLSSQIDRTKSWLLLLLFGIMTPLGAAAGYYFGSSFASFNMDFLLAVVVGMFLHISTTIIFETNENHTFNFLKLISILVGASLAFLF